MRILMTTILSCINIVTNLENFSTIPDPVAAILKFFPLLNIAYFAKIVLKIFFMLIFVIN